MSSNVFKPNVKAMKTGNYGGLILLNGLGVQSVRTIVRMAMHGNIYRMTNHDPVPIVGVRTDWEVSVIKNSDYVSHWRSGTGVVPTNQCRLIFIKGLPE